MGIEEQAASKAQNDNIGEAELQQLGQSVGAFLGEIRMFAGTFAPRGWEFCHGQLLPIATNSALFSLLGITYGGDGRVTFGLPDYRGRTPVGAGNGPGLTDIRLGSRLGREHVELTQSQLPTFRFKMADTSVNLTFEEVDKSQITLDDFKVKVESKVAVPTYSGQNQASSGNGDHGIGTTSGFGGIFSSSNTASGKLPEFNVTSQETNITDVKGNLPNSVKAKIKFNTDIEVTGGNQSFGIRNPGLGSHYIICVEGIYPSRS